MLVLKTILHPNCLQDINECLRKPCVYLTVYVQKDVKELSSVLSSSLVQSLSIYIYINCLKGVFFPPEEQPLKIIGKLFSVGSKLQLRCQ